MILSGGGEKIILNVNIFLEFLYKNIFVVDTFRVRYFPGTILFVRTFGFFVIYIYLNTQYLWRYCKINKSRCTSLKQLSQIINL